jgi:zinc transporter ZupT
MQQFGAAVLASVSAGVVTTLGILAIRRYETWARNNTTYFACFAAGVLITVSFLHIIPESVGMSPHAPIYMFAGYLFLLALNHFLTAHVCDEPRTISHMVGITPLIGIGLHSFLDGVVYSVGFNVGAATGALMALGMVLHEFPEGIVTYALLVRAGFSDRRSFLLAFGAAALTTPIGTLASFPFISSIDAVLLGDLFAFSAGALIYVGATHLLPQAEREPRKFHLAALAAGVVVAAGIVFTS